jgi:hypothetical protein
VHTAETIAQGQHTSSHAIARFEYLHTTTAPLEISSRGESRKTGAHDQD